MKKIVLNSILTATLSACIGWSNVANAQALFKDLVPGANQGSQPKDFITVSGTMYFITIINGSRTKGLWKTDGTTVGTMELYPMLKDDRTLLTFQPKPKSAVSAL